MLFEILGHESNFNGATHFVCDRPFGSAWTQKAAHRADPNGRLSAFRLRATHFRSNFEPDLRRRGHATDACILAFSSPRARWSVAHWPPLTPSQQQPSPASFVADAAIYFCR